MDSTILGYSGKHVVIHYDLSNYLTPIHRHPHSSSSHPTPIHRHPTSRPIILRQYTAILTPTCPISILQYTPISTSTCPISLLQYTSISTSTCPISLLQYTSISTSTCPISILQYTSVSTSTWPISLLHYTSVSTSTWPIIFYTGSIIVYMHILTFHVLDCPGSPGLRRSIRLFHRAVESLSNGRPGHTSQPSLGPTGVLRQRGQRQGHRGPRLA